MCGIYGVIYARNQRSSLIRESYRRKFIQLAIANTKRGEDATGVLRVDKSKLVIFKRSKPIWNNLVHPKWMSTTSLNENTVAFIGHNRERSSKAWSNDAKFAHPHIAGNLIGVHNGTISNYNDVFTDADHDSIALFRFIYEHGVDQLNKLVGSMAVCYLNFKSNPNVFYFISHDRPLHYLTENGVFIFSSEADHLSSVIETKSTTWSLKSGYLLKVNANKNLKTSWRTIPEPARYKTWTPANTNSSNSSLLNNSTVYDDSDDIDYAWYSGWRENSTPSLHGPPPLTGVQHGLNFSQQSTTKKESCHLCNRELYSEVLVFDESGVFKRKQCLTCKPDRCIKCNTVTNYQRENIMVMVDNSMYCKSCYLEMMNKERLPNASESRTIICSSCGNTVMLCSTVMTFTLKSGDKGPLFQHICCSCISSMERKEHEDKKRRLKEALIREESYVILDLNLLDLNSTHLELEAPSDNNNTGDINEKINAVLC